MATAPSISQVASKLGLDAALAALNTGGAGVIKIFSGSIPNNTETADTGTLLATLTLTNPAFPASATSSSPRGAIATANAITAAAAVATNTAGYFRGYRNTPTTTNADIQGTCGTASADMILNTTSIVSGGNVSISSWTVTLPDGGV